MDQEKKGLKGITISCGSFYTRARNVKFKSQKKCIYFHETTLLLKNEKQSEKFFQSLIIWLSFWIPWILRFFFLHVDRDKSMVMFFFQSVKRLLINLGMFMCLQIDIFVFVGKISIWKEVCLPKNDYWSIPSAEKLLALLKVLPSVWKEPEAMFFLRKDAEGENFFYTSMFNSTYYLFQ